jgi:hypothetical protein
MKSEEFDKQVRTMLGSREIEPSATAWDRVRSGLDEAGGNNNRRRYPAYVAACVVAVVAGLMVLLLKSEPRVQNYPVVQEERSQPENVPEKASEPVVLPDESRHGGGALAVRPAAVKEELAEKPAEAHVPAPRESVAMAAGNLKAGVALKAIASSSEKGSRAVSEAEIDSLLSRARTVLDHENTGRSSRVNAATLLEDVEEELDQNFKDKALETVKKQFIRLRTAVAERKE